MDDQLQIWMQRLKQQRRHSQQESWQEHEQLQLPTQQRVEIVVPRSNSHPWPPHTSTSVSEILIAGV
jgi:hypothetical protein